MARKGRKPDGIKRDIHSFSFKLDRLNPEEQAFCQALLDHYSDPNFSLRAYLNDMHGHYHGHVPDKTKEVASAIREATQGLWDMFNELIQVRSMGGGVPTREDFHRFAQDQGVEEWDAEFVDGMLGSFGKLDED